MRPADREAADREADKEADSLVGGTIFVYYRVASGHEARLRAAFARLAADLSMPEVRDAALMRRAGDGTATREPDTLQTWMEVYRLVPWPRCGAVPADATDAGVTLDILQKALETRARQAGIVELVDGARHYEAFVACA